jgi:hypothetical protein
MGDFQIKKSGKIYDAVIVGSGAGGGMAAYVLSHAGLKVCYWKQGPFSTLQSIQLSLNSVMNLRAVEPVPKPGISAILMLPLVDGTLKESHIPQRMKLNLSGFAPVCWAVEQTIGDGSHFVSDQKISSPMTALANAGQLLMMK